MCRCNVYILEFSAMELHEFKDDDWIVKLRIYVEIVQELAVSTRDKGAGSKPVSKILLKIGWSDDSAQILLTCNMVNIHFNHVPQMFTTENDSLSVNYQ